MKKVRIPAYAILLAGTATIALWAFTGNKIKTKEPVVNKTVKIEKCCANHKDKQE
jgi:hypothetical protein